MPEREQGPRPWERLGVMYTTEDVAEWLKVDVVTVRRLISRGELPALRIGGEYRFTDRGLRDFIQRQQLETSPEVAPDAELAPNQDGDDKTQGSRGASSQESYGTPTSQSGAGPLR